MKVVFFGTPPFAAEVLDYLLKNGIEVAAVISKPDRPKGRSGTPVPTPVKTVALAQQPPLPVFQPEIVSNLEFAEVLQSFQADLFVVVAYGEIIKQHLLDMPRLGCINLHASLLPKYRGAAPIQRCLIDGEKETGATIMYMVRKMDAGDMIETVKIPISPDLSFGELEHQLCEAGKKLLLKVLQDLEQGQIQRIAQDHEKATLAPKIELEDCEIDWNQSAQMIHNLVRGVNPYPGAWCYIKVKEETKRLKIWQTQVINDAVSAKPGTILSQTQEDLILSTSQGALRLLEVQLEGKKRMNSRELLRGIPLSSLSFISI